MCLFQEEIIKIVMEANANFIVPPDQINFKTVYENINGICNGSE